MAIAHQNRVAAHLADYLKEAAKQSKPAGSTAALILTAWAIARRLNDGSTPGKADTWQISQKLLAAETGQTVRHIRELVKTLEALGVIKTHGYKQGQRRAKSYTLALSCPDYCARTDHGTAPKLSTENNHSGTTVPLSQRNPSSPHIELSLIELKDDGQHFLEFEEKHITEALARLVEYGTTKTLKEKQKTLIQEDRGELLARANQITLSNGKKPKPQNGPTAYLFSLMMQSPHKLLKAPQKAHKAAQTPTAEQLEITRKHYEKLREDGQRAKNWEDLTPEEIQKENALDLEKMHARKLEAEKLTETLKAKKRFRVMSAVERLAKTEGGPTWDELTENWQKWLILRTSDPSKIFGQRNTSENYQFHKLPISEYNFAANRLKEGLDLRNDSEALARGKRPEMCEDENQQFYQLELTK
jgi:hypothetical protein